ncbi:MAG: penicillin-binding protein activator [bacterium]|nr:penicillin-binding protein activator [bacterium]
MPLLSVAADLDDNQEFTALSAQAKTALADGNWQEARRLTEELATRFPDSPRRDQFLFDHAKATYHAGDHAAAATEFGQFISQFPKSTFLPAAHYFRACSWLLQEKRDEAAIEFLQAYINGADAALTTLIADALATFDRPHLSILFSQASTASLSDLRRCELIREISTHLIEQQRMDDAVLLLSRCSSTSVSADAAEALPEVVRVAVAVPLTGEYQKYGEEILNGAMIALQAQPSSGRKIRLVPFDTQSDPVMAGRICRELADLKYDAIIGPLTSNEAAVAASAMNDQTIPIIIPAATSAGVTLLGGSAFQLSPNVELQGIRMAEYARRTLNADTALIITPTGFDYLQIGQAFAQRFEQLGGVILGVEYYRSSDRDFGLYIQSAKRLILRGFDESATYLDSRGDTIETEAVPARTDIIFLPGPTDQLRLLLPQIRFYKLEGTLLGSDGWGSEEIYSLGADVVGGALFASPFVLQGSRQPEFARTYQSHYGEVPTRIAALGYDAANLLILTLSQNPATRLDWLTALAQISDIEGASGKISFGQYRENVELPLYRIEGGRAIPVVTNRGVAAESPVDQ